MRSLADQDSLQRLRTHGRNATLLINACLEIGEPIAENDGSYSEIGLGGRAFFIGRTISELQVTGYFAKNACEQLRVSQPKDNALLLSAIFMQQKSCLQKLFEALTYCVHFKKADNHESFEHYLRLLDLDQILAKTADLREYFGQISASELEREKHYRAAILKLEAATPSLKSQWYAKRSSRRLQDAGCNLVSAKKLYQQTHLLIGEPLQMVIAAAFEIVFTSGDDAVHFYPSKLRAFGAEDFSLVSYIFDIQSLLANAVLRECCYLAETAGGACCQRILESPELTEWCKGNRCDRESAPELQKGDYVVAHLCLCKIVDLHRSPYGLVSCNVELIDRAFPQKIPMEGDNWIRANHVRLFLKATDPRAKDLALVMDLWSEEIDEIV